MLGHGLDLFIEELFEPLFQLRRIPSSLADDARDLFVEGERVEQVFDRDVFVTPADGFTSGQTDCNLDFGRWAHVTYSGSVDSRSGMPCSRAKRWT